MISVDADERAAYEESYIVAGEQNCSPLLDLVLGHSNLDGQAERYNWHDQAVEENVGKNCQTDCQDNEYRRRPVLEKVWWLRLPVFCPARQVDPYSVQESPAS